MAVHIARLKSQFQELGRRRLNLSLPAVSKIDGACGHGCELQANPNQQEPTVLKASPRSGQR